MARVDDVGDILKSRLIPSQRVARFFDEKATVLELFASNLICCKRSFDALQETCSVDDIEKCLKHFATVESSELVPTSSEGCE